MKLIKSIKNSDKKEGLRAFWVVLIISIIVTATFIILIPALLIADYSNYSVMPPFNDTLQFFYQTNGFLALLFLIWLFVVMFLKRSRKILTNICFWGILIFAVLYASNFASNIYYLNKVAADSIFAFIATYMPTLCLIAALIAFFSCIDNQHINKFNKFISICAVISVFMTAYYCFRACIENIPEGTVQKINLWMVVTGALTIALINVMLSIITDNKRVYDRIINGFTEKEAAIEELAYETAETMAENIKDEIKLLEEIAEVVDKSSLETDNKNK